VRGDDDLAHYMHATGRLRKNVRILVRIAKRLRDERDQLAGALAEERHQVAVEVGEAERLEALLEREAQVNKVLIVTAESLAASMMNAEAKRDQLRAVVIEYQRADAEANDALEDADVDESESNQRIARFMAARDALLAFDVDGPVETT
jgi:hypothetical protein